MTEVEQPSQNGIELTTEEDDNSKARPADIEQDMREMERRKRVEAIMGSKLFREELERIVDSQIREGGASGILQQLSDIVGVPTTRVGNVFKSSNCVLPINDIRGVESMGYSKGEKILRCKLAATFRLLDLYGWTKGLGAQITARLKVDQELFLVNPYGLLYHEVTASSLNKVDMQGNVVEQGTTNFGVNKNQFMLHSVVHAARPDIRCAIYIGCNPVIAVSSLKVGLLPLTNDSVILGEISTHPYTGSLADVEEREKLVRNLGPISKVMLLSNHGALCCGETIEEAFFAAHHIVQACETQLKLLPVGVDNLVLIPEESRKAIYDAARRPPEDLAAAFEKKAALVASASEDASTDKDESQTDNSKDTSHKLLQQPKWRVGGAEFEALMRMLDNAGFRTGYIYRHPLIKSELPKPKNDVEVPPAVSSLGYLLEEEELYRQGIWKKGDWRKGGDRSRWLNSPNVYQKVEVLETGTPDPKKITKWVAEGSPTHSTPVRIEGALQFVPPGTNPREFKKVQQQIKDNRRADKISAGPQSHILEGVTWDEANRIKDATVSSAGDHVVLMGAASKGIIQRGFQHNATVYKAPYAKNPFDNVTDDELNEYKRTVERKKNIHGEYTDTDFSESEALSSLQTSGAQQQNSSKTAAVSQSETEDASEHQVMRIETKQAPVPSQPEVVLSDAQDSDTVRTFNTPVTIITLDRSEENIEQEQDMSSDIYTSSYDGSYHQQFFNPLFADNVFMPHPYYLPQNTHSKENPNEIQYGLFPLKLEITTSDIYPPEDYNSECYTPRMCYPVMQPDMQGQLQNGMLFSVAYSKTQFPQGDENNKGVPMDFKPYRTLSHFGFNYPRLRSTPEHYHIPMSPTKYVPLKKSFSYNEIFSSPRYNELCDTCFKKVLQFRPELPLFKCPNENHFVDQEIPKSWEEKVNLDNDNNYDTNEFVIDNDGDSFELLDAFKNWIDSEQMNLSRVLEPVIEVDEEDQVSEENVAVVESKSQDESIPTAVEESSSTFIDKITRMNYSEESTNVGFQPSSIPSDMSEITENCEDNAEEVATAAICLSAERSPEVTNVLLLPAEQPFSDDRTADVTSSTEAVSMDSDTTNTRKLMTREERNQRKQEFTELWEDHIQFFTPQEVSDSEDESDLERNKSEIFFGESRVSSMSLQNEDGEEQSATSDSASGTFRITSPSSSERAVHASPSTEFYSFAETENLASDSELNSIEHLIIDKIKVNNLNEKDPIFDDIEMTIRHKITPSKLEIMVQKQRGKDTPPAVLSSTPDGGSSHNADSFYSLNMSMVEKKDEESRSGGESVGGERGSHQRRSRSLVSESRSRNRRLKHVPTFRDLSKVERTHSSSASTLSSSTDVSPPDRPVREFSAPSKPKKYPKHAINSDCSDCLQERKRVKRNFVAENIRNAAMPRRRSNVSSYLTSKEFRTSTSNPCLLSDKSSEKTIPPPVYSFQTKTIRGSPRFWVTLSPREKESTTPPRTVLKNGVSGRKRKDKVRFECDGEQEPSVDSDMEMKKMDGEIVEMKASLTSNVETEIECLGQQISDLKPRLDQYKKTIDEYNEQIIKASHNMDDIVRTQIKIEDSRRKLSEDIVLSQYVDKISCDVQTFSISEADD